MAEIFATHGLRPDPYEGPRLGARSAWHTVTAFHRALNDGAVDISYRLIWDLVDRQVVGFDALPVLRGDGGRRLAAGDVWSIAERAGLVSDLMRSMRASVEESQRNWERFGLVAPVSIAPVPARSGRRALGRRSGRPPGRPTVSIDLDPGSSHELYGLSADRWWRVHLPAEEAVAELRRVIGAGAVTGAVRLSETLVHQFTRDATQLTLVARCIESARRNDLRVQADGADDCESVKGLVVLGCHQAAGAGLGADLPPSEIPTLRWVSPTLRAASNRPLRVVAG